MLSSKDGSELLSLYGEEAGEQFGSAAGGLAKGQQAFFIVGAPNAGPGDRGRAYVYRGREGKLAFVIESDEQDSQLGGMFVSVVGDVNADGTPDVYASDWSHHAKGRSTDNQRLAWLRCRRSGAGGTADPSRLHR